MNKKKPESKFSLFSDSKYFKHILNYKHERVQDRRKRLVGAADYVRLQQKVRVHCATTPVRRRKASKEDPVRVASRCTRPYMEDGSMTHVVRIDAVES